MRQAHSFKGNELLNNSDSCNKKYIYFDNFTMMPFDHSSKADYDNFRSILVDEEIMKTVSLFNYKAAKDEEKIKQIFATLTEANQLSEIPLSYKIIALDGDFMGFIAPAILKKDENQKIRILDYGCLVRKKYRVGSVAWSAYRAVIRQSFKISSVERVVASVLPSNYNSQAIMLRIGFKYVSQIKKSQNNNLNIFKITKDDFESVKRFRVKNIREFIDQMPKSPSHKNLTGDEFSKLLSLS